MVLADMANAPEHDFAPAWLKIPSNQQSSKPAHVKYTSDSGFRSRHCSIDSNQVHVRSPTHEPFGFRGRDEHRNYFGASFRHHSVDDLPWDPDPTTNWNVSQFNGNSSHAYGAGFPRRESSVPRNGQQYSTNGRFDTIGSGFTTNRGQFHQGKSSGRQRYHSGPKSGYSEHPEDHRNETSGKSKTEEGVQGEKAEDAGKESDNQSALSNQDFPSLSGSGDDVDPGVASKKNVPAGAWEKPPGTTKIIGGRKLQLIKKTIPSSLDSKTSGRPPTSSSSEGAAGSKVGGQPGSSSQNSKIATVTVGSNVVLKSMTSIAPLASPRTKETPIRTAPMPSSLISPVSNKPSRSTPVTSTNPPPTPTNKAPINKPLISKIAVDNVLAIKTPSLTPKPKPVPATGANPPVPIDQDPTPTKAKTSVDKFPLGSISSRNTPSSTKPILTDSSKNGYSSEKPATTPTKFIVTTKSTATTKLTAAPTKLVITNLSNGPSFSSKPKSITNLSTSKSTSQTLSKPTSVTNMSSVLLAHRPTPSTPNRLSSAPTRPPVPVNRSAPRPSPLSSNRHSPVTIPSRLILAPAINSTHVSLRSGSIGLSSNKKEKTVSLVRGSTPQSSPKEHPSPLPSVPSHPDLPLPSPTTPKPKKGDKLDFLNELRRSNREDLPKEISQKNQNNLQKVEEHATENGPASAPKTIFPEQHQDIKTNGIDIHHDFPAIDKGSKDDEIYPVFSPPNTKEPLDMSSSLEAEKRLLQEMGWHEHSDNEEGYAPLTEEELREFQKRSQQLKKNGLTKPLRVAWNNVNLPIGSITQFSLGDSLTSSESDSSDDEMS